MTHEGSTIVSLRSTVQKAAKLIVVETGELGPKFKPYRPMTSKVPRQRVRHDVKTAKREARIGMASGESQPLCL